MQRLTLLIPVGTRTRGETFGVFVSADADGMAVGSVDYTRMIGGHRTAFLALRAESGSGYVSVVSPPLYCGWYRFAAVAYDQVGNASAGTPAEFAAFVNSGPRPPRDFRQDDVAADGRPEFAFTPPAQLA